MNGHTSRRLRKTLPPNSTAAAYRALKKAWKRMPWNQRNRTLLLVEQNLANAAKAINGNTVSS